MSKIYEALLRAERDRLSGNTPPATPSDAPQPVHHVSAVAVVEAPADLPAEAWPQPEVAASAAPFPAAPPAIDTPLPPAAAAAPAITLPTESYLPPAPAYAPVVQRAEALAPAPAPVAARPVAPPAPPVAAAPIADRIERRSAAPVAAASVQPVAPQAAAPAATQHHTNGNRADVLDISRVRSLPWSPSMYHLPALEERGRSVEQFRSLRSRMHEFRDLNTLKSILVSSGLPQEGKTFIAANLAVAFARHKSSRVLLIDGDMRRSSLHQLLGTTSEPGLAEYLAGNADVVDIMQTASPSSHTSAAQGLSSLTFIGAGKDTNTAADLSGNYRFDNLIEAVSPHFDWIVVDSSPVNLVADGVNLARACDGVLLVARAGATKFEAAQRALVELKASNILGFVLNAVPKPPSSGGYYGYDNYDTYDTYEALEKTEA